MAVVVDTDVVSYIVKGDTRGTLYQPHLANQIATISFITLAELERWGIIANWEAPRQQKLKTHLRRYVVQHSNAQLCRLWAETVANARRAGKPVGVADAWVAATAQTSPTPVRHAQPRSLYQCHWTDCYFRKLTNRSAAKRNIRQVYRLGMPSASSTTWAMQHKIAIIVER